MVEFSNGIWTLLANYRSATGSRIDDSETELHSTNSTNSTKELMVRQHNFMHQLCFVTFFGFLVRPTMFLKFGSFSLCLADRTQYDGLLLV